MSALGHQRTFLTLYAMSASPSKVDIRGRAQNNRKCSLPSHISWVGLWVSQIQLIDREADQ